MKKNVLVLLTILLVASFSHAQSNDQGLASLQFNFLNPGARSIAMGGAFVGLADDATAALANPAGLAIFIKPEVSVEFSVTNYSNPIPFFSGTGTLQTRNEETRTTVFNVDYDLRSEDFPSDVQNLSFASFVYPWPKHRFVLSGFYNEQTKFERDYKTEAIPMEPSLITFSAQDSSLDLALKNVGVSVSYGISPKFSIGGTLNFVRLDIRSSNKRINDIGTVSVETLLNGKDDKLSGTFGALWRPSEKFSFGAVYTHRPEFDVETSNIASGKPAPGNPTDNKFRIPDAVSLGVSLKPYRFFLVDFDIVRVSYSQLMDGYYNAQFSEGTQRTTAKDFAKTSLEVEDGTEYHVGLEYTWPVGSGKLISMRSGYWREPYHSIMYRVNDNEVKQVREGGDIINDTRVVPFYLRSFRRDYNHVSFGSGLIFPRFTIDWAYDYSKNFKRLVISSFFRL